MARIEIFWEGNTREYNIGQEIFIGRDESCDIKVPSIKASRRHCRIFKGTGGYFLEDLGSSNGTVLNGVMIGRKLLKHNDEITVGRIKLRFIDKTEDPLIGKRLGRYQIIEKLGVGAEGVVYHGRQVALNKDVAVKLLRNKFIIRKGGIEVVRKASNVAVNFNHPNVVKIFEFAEDNGRCFYSMELLLGEDLLSKCIRKRRIKIIDAVKYGICISSALTALHSLGVLHGDIKPHNILIDKDKNLKLIDLGWIPFSQDKPLRNNDHGSEEETEESKYNDSNVFATPQYVAPELIKHQARMPQSDIYAMSVTIYQLITGELPYKSNHLEELLKQHIQGEVKNPVEINSKIPAELAELILAGMNSDVNKRIKTAEEYYQRLVKIDQQITKSRQQKKEQLIKNLKMQRFSFRSIGLGYKLLILLSILLLGASYGVRKYKEYSADLEKEQVMQLDLGNELYSSGDYEKAKTILTSLINSGPNSDVEIGARRILELLDLPDEVKELQLLKKKLQTGKVSNSKLVEILREKIRSKELTVDIEKEYIAYLKSIGGDTDVRYNWQKDIDSKLAEGKFVVAYDDLYAINSAEFSKYEKNEYQQYLQRITATLNKMIEDDYDVAGTYLKSRRINEACVILERIADIYPPVLGWRERILDYFAVSNEAFCTKIADSFSVCLAKINALDATGLREEVFKLDSYATKQVSKIDTSYIHNLPIYIEAFSSAVINKIKSIKSTTGKLALLEVMINGRNELVEVEVEGDSLAAYVGGRLANVKIQDILLSSIEKILPAFEITPEEAIGAGVYFSSHGAKNIAMGYFEAAKDGENSKFLGTVNTFLEVLSGYCEVPVAKDNKNIKILSNSSIKLGGLRIILPTLSAEYTFETAKNGKLIVSVKDSELEIFLQKNSGKQLLGKAIVMPQEGRSIDIKGYWDKLIVSQNDIIVGTIDKEAVGDIVIAPNREGYGMMDLKKRISITLPHKKTPSDINTDVLG